MCALFLGGLFRLLDYVSVLRAFFLLLRGGRKELGAEHVGERVMVYTPASGRGFVGKKSGYGELGCTVLFRFAN